MATGPRVDGRSADALCRSECYAEDCAAAGLLADRARRAKTVERFQCAEEKHVQDVRSFRALKIFHVKAEAQGRHSRLVGHIGAFRKGRHVAFGTKSNHLEM